MLEVITPYAPLISAGSALISAIAVLISTFFVIWTACFRKTRRDRIDELKIEMNILFSKGWASKIIGNNQGEEQFYQALNPKFQKNKYKVLHQCAYDELGHEGRNPVVKFYEAEIGEFEYSTLSRRRDL